MGKVKRLVEISGCFIVFRERTGLDVILDSVQNVLSMIKVMNNETMDPKEKQRVMDIIKISSEEEEMEVSNMAPTADKDRMLEEYIVKAKKKTIQKTNIHRTTNRYRWVFLLM